MEIPIDVIPERVGQLGLVGLPACDQRTIPGIISQRACVLYGARWMLAPVRDVIHLIHGPVGCAYYSETVRKKRYQVFSTALDEMDIVFGAGQKLETAIRESLSLRPGSSAVLVYTTCAAGLIGEDVPAICKRMSATLGRPVVPVNCPGFCGVSQGDGHDVAAAVLLEHFIGREPAGTYFENHVNILGEFDVQGDLKEIEHLLQRMGLNLICVVSGRATVENMARAHRAKLNIVHCGRTGRWLARKMKERFGIPWRKVSFFGVEETVAALQTIATFFNRSVESEWVEREAEAARQKAAPYLKLLAGKRVALFFGASRMGSMARAFKELGMEVVLCGSQFGCREDYAESRRCLGKGALMIDDANQRELEEFFYRFRPDLLVGGTREKFMAHKIGIPFLIFPQETSPYAGFNGFVNLAREVAALLRAPVWRLMIPANLVEPPASEQGSTSGDFLATDNGFLLAKEEEIIMNPGSYAMTEIIGRSLGPETFKVAVATRDGLRVNEHFGRADSFMIFTLQGNKVKKAEFREISCLTGPCAGDEHKDAIVKMLEQLADCRAVICLKAGQCVQEKARQKGILILEINDTISDALKEYLRYYAEKGGDMNEGTNL
ncbi:nitrogenase component 1 [Carboxydothermus pertinax]|uniref:Nitrogenase n=1 Tax=Carboxydothermus pertinax TaxID=870242 RepID=A0A1L8CX83_9THEO|nr:nitrogenase component 1 [Carboxydothermus pertinax]GAV23484.1 nitrogenase [Carboxydothermus pertinax]